MADEKKNEVRYDTDGNDIITETLIELLSTYPGLGTDEEITFATLSEESGMAMFPVSGAVIKAEKKSVTGDIEQECLYPMYIFYRVCGPSQAERMRIKEWLDMLGKWLERQTVTIDGEYYKLESYPDIGDDTRYFEYIHRTGSSYLNTVTADRTEDWVIPITAQYHNEF